VSLRLRQLRLRALTGAIVFGVDLRFDDGLVVLRADNTSGKSTCINAILYALGVEGMLGTSYAVPLPHAMTHSIEAPDGSEHPVLESYVVLEIENAGGDVLTIKRMAKSQGIDERLITAWNGANTRSCRE